MANLKKINAWNYDQIKKTIKEKSLRAAAHEWGISVGTCERVSRFKDYNEYVIETRKIAKKAYELRKNKIKKSIGQPFAGTSAPAPIIPTQGKIEESKNGPITTIKLNYHNPESIEEYKGALKEAQAEIEKLKEHKKRLLDRVETLSQDLVKVSKVNKEFADELDKAKRHANAQEDKLNMERANIAQAAANLGTTLSPEGQVVDIPQNGTKIEITVGDAHIVITGGNSGILQTR